MPGILCEHCTGYCCRYIALPIDEPTTSKDFDDIRWYLLHEGVSVFVEGGEWFINIQTVCRHLQPDYRCGIYETRPKICRDYSTESCDYHSGDYGWEQHFTCPEHLDAYQREHRVGLNGKRSAKRKAQRDPARNSDGNSANATGNRARAQLKARARLKARPGRRAARAPAPIDYAAATHDIHGRPLPILQA